MRYSKAFIPTQKEAPKDATTPSHSLLLRAGYARMVGAGIYELLPLGMRVLTRISTIIRDEMDRAGAQEFLMPAIVPAEYFKESGRWDSFGPALFRLNDRKGGEYHLGPTHEEVITDLVRREVRSYRQLPLSLYQVQMKYRDEPRPRAGLLRCREFLMKDAYTFDVDEAAATESYGIMREAYKRIFSRLGLDYRIVEADSGAMGGSTSAEFQVLAQNGEDAIVACGSCDYAANVEVAEAHFKKTEQTNGKMGAREKVHTPGVHSIGEVISFLGGGLRPESTLKSMIYIVDGKPVMALVRGDHEVNEVKLARVLDVEEVRLASDKEVKKATGASVGFAGPVDFDGRLIVDRAVTHVLDAVVGANETDHHFRNVNHGRDFTGDVHDLHLVTEGDGCPKCNDHLRLYRGIEGGHIFILGTHYSAKMGATFVNDGGKSLPVVMGCYGIGVTRLIAAAVEQYNDDDGILWPMAIAPYQVHIAPLGNDGEVAAKSEEVYQALRAAGVDALIDDRKERPGVKFKDADLLGMPIRVTIGKRGLASGEAEVKERNHKDAEAVSFDTLIDHLTALVVKRGGRLLDVT